MNKQVLGSWLMNCECGNYPGDTPTQKRVSLLLIWNQIKRVIRRKSFSKGIYVFRMRDKFFTYYLINICAPTNNKPDVLKGELHESLDKDSANGEKIKKRNEHTTARNGSTKRGSAIAEAQESMDGKDMRRFHATVDGVRHKAVPMIVMRNDPEGHLLTHNTTVVAARLGTL